MFTLITISLAALAAGALFLCRPRPDGTPRIRSDAATMFVAISFTGLVGLAASALVAGLLQ